MSPRPGISTLITSAPIQASSCVAVGAAWTCPRSRMRTPSRALLMHLPPSTPAQAGAYFSTRCAPDEWIPAFAGMTPFGVEKIAVLLDMRGKSQRVLAREALGKVGVAPFQRVNDPHVVRDRARRAIALVDRDLADRPHVDEQVLGHFRQQEAAAHS